MLFELFLGALAFLTPWAPSDCLRRSLTSALRLSPFLDSPIRYLGTTSKEHTKHWPSTKREPILYAQIILFIAVHV